MTADARTYAAEKRSAFERHLRELAEIPTVSADPARRPEIRRCADAAMALLSSMGARTALWQTSGNPIVFGALEAAPGRPGLAFYNHLDVQPADEPEWRSEPFRMRIDGDRYLGRGTTDDKGPALACLFAARHARERDVPLNLYFVWELEEEIGSPHFAEGLAAHRQELPVQSVMVSDSIWISRERPSADYGLRGFLGLLLRLQTADVDCHSGVCGGPAPNPIAELCRVLGTLFDATTGDVKIPGFYDDVAAPTAEELDDFVASGFSVDAFARTYGFRWLRYRDPREVLRRAWAWPTLEVHGIVGGYQGPGLKSIIPHAAEAKLSVRLVPHQRPEAIRALLEREIHRLSPAITLETAGEGPAFLGERRGPLADALRRSVAKACGSEPAFVRGGGSIGAVITLREQLGVPVMMMGLSLPEHGYHAPNEYFDWQQAARGIELFSHYCDELAAAPLAHGA